MSEEDEPGLELVGETSSLISKPASEGLVGGIIEQKGAQHGEGGALGAKTITFGGSLVLLLNNLCGPGMLAIPVVMQEAGWFTTCSLMIVMFVIASFTSTMLCEAMARIPGNSNFQKRFEYCTLVEHYYGRNAFLVCQLMFNVCVLALNIASIVVSAQAMDNFLAFLSGQSYALQYLPDVRWISSHEPGNQVFDPDVSVISLGYLLVMIFCIPMGFLNLDDNIIFQYFSFALMMIILGEFFVQFLLRPLDPSQTPAFGSNNNQVMGVLIFSYAYVITIPSWVNEKEKSISVNKTLWTSTAISTAIYLVTGTLGAWAYPNMRSDDILNVMSRPSSPLITLVSVFLFSIGTIAPGVSVYSIMVRYNLFVGKICNAEWSSFWGVIFPWLIGFLFYQGDGFANLVNWTSLTISSVMNFVLPPIIYMKALSTTEGESAFQSVPSWLTTKPRRFALGLVILISIMLVVQFTTDFIALWYYKESLVDAHVQRNSTVT